VVSQTGLRVVRSNSCKGPSVSWKRAKQQPKGQTKILGPASIIWDQIYGIWCQKGQPGNPVNSNRSEIAQRSEISLDTGSGVPVSTPPEFCVFLSDPDPESKFGKNRSWIWSHFSISAVAGVCMVIS